MKAFTALTIAASFFLGSQASPIEVEERGISAKVTLCSRPNLQDCDTTYIPIDTCYQVNPCKIESLNTGGHVCDFYSQPGCGGQKYQYYRTRGSQPLGIEIQSVFCW
ncbi:hypothetical protein K4F52_000258 [Lecanicillium sp. MT-2017a]|nr:hypothetical protein K4F52_000258 [Lecanicillium sp. MT-2017a]